MLGEHDLRDAMIDVSLKGCRPLCLWIGRIHWSAERRIVIASSACCRRTCWHSRANDAHVRSILVEENRSQRNEWSEQGPICAHSAKRRCCSVAMHRGLRPTLQADPQGFPNGLAIEIPITVRFKYHAESREATRRTAWTFVLSVQQCCL